MTIYLQSIDFNLSDVVIKGPYVSTKNDNRTVIEKSMEEWKSYIENYAPLMQKQLIFYAML